MTLKIKLVSLVGFLIFGANVSAQINIEYCDTIFYHNYKDQTGQHCLFKSVISQDGFYKALKNKNPVEVFYVKDHKVSGPYQYFKSDGLVVIDGNYSAGFKSGIWRSFNLVKPSLLLSNLIYAEGKLQGKALYYDAEEGLLQFKGSYKNNKKAGKWKIYKKGKLEGKLKFRNGNVLPSYKETELWKTYKWRLESTQ